MFVIFLPTPKLQVRSVLFVYICHLFANFPTATGFPATRRPLLVSVPRVATWCPCCLLFATLEVYGFLNCYWLSLNKNMLLLVGYWLSPYKTMLLLVGCWLSPKKTCCYWLAIGCIRIKICCYWLAIGCLRIKPCCYWLAVDCLRIKHAAIGWLLVVSE
jgi:hypothetical protein